MKAIIRETRSHRARWWALRIRGAPAVLTWTLSSTRREAREVRDELQGSDPLIHAVDVVEVKIHLESKQ